MNTLNFEVLRNHAPDLADTGGFAERYIYTDPASSVVKLRIIAEQMVLHIFDCLNISIPNKPKLNDLLHDPAFEHVVPVAVRYKLDAVRINGNAGAHGRHISEETALWLLRETFQLVCWFFLAYLCREKQPCPEFQAPSEPLPEPVCMDLVLESRDFCIPEPEFGEPLDPDADLQAMNMRRTLRKELGKKSQNEARDIGEEAATTLHLKELPHPD